MRGTLSKTGHATIRVLERQIPILSRIRSLHLRDDGCKTSVAAAGAGGSEAGLDSIQPELSIKKGREMISGCGLVGTKDKQR